MTLARRWIVLLVFAALLLAAFSSQAHSVLWWVVLAPVLFFWGLIALQERVFEYQLATPVSPCRFALPARAPPLS